jgi:tetratricopeptide (TPR) repeat protein
MQLMNEVIEYEGKRYVLTDTGWVDEDAGLEPPLRIIQILNRRLDDLVGESGGNRLNPNELIEQAKRWRDSGQLSPALRFARTALQRAPSSAGIASVLSSILREVKRPEEAIRETDRFRDIDYVPLLTSRAAAFCDLERWPDALNCMRRVWRLRGGEADPESLKLWKRIRVGAPELFPKGAGNQL